MATAGLLGYADRLSVRAGERISFKVSTTAPTYRAEILRLDRGPTAPGELAPATVMPGFSAERSGIAQDTNPGSFVMVNTWNRGVQYVDGFTVQLWMQPTMLGNGRVQGLCAHTWDGRLGWELWIDDDGRLTCRLDAPNLEPLRCRAPLPRRGSWFFVAASYDPATGDARLTYRELRPRWLREATESIVERRADARVEPGGNVLFFGALGVDRTQREGMAPIAGFNGKIDRPRLWSRALSAAELDALAAGADPLGIGDGLIAAWDFSLEVGSTTVRDTSPNGLNGSTVNAPTRGMTGANWDGSATSLHIRQEQYGAIAFHEDDLEDADWDQSLRYELPADLRSGIYAARLAAEDGREREEIPFYVRPAAGAPTAPILVLAPTNTYLAYANERLHHDPGNLRMAGLLSDAEIRTWPWQEVVDAHPELGASCYDRHPDGSGVCFSSRLRPIVTMRSDFVLSLTGCARHFSADLYLIEWLERSGFSYDVATDEDLHLEGQALLAPYRVVLTGSHPEYWTAPMLDGLEAYLAAGGKLMYLGGNGFYWVTAIDPNRPHLIEVRRGNAGTRCWDSAPGESDLSLTGEPGGLWRHRGRSPQRLTGVGFAAEGWGGAPGYRRLQDSFRPEVAFIFEGIDKDETIGDFGLVMGGAVGDEIDRYDLALGTPPETLRLATSEGQHTDCYQLVIEDVTQMTPGYGGTEHPDVRADMTYLDLPNGGAVFSVGSINWSGSLPHNGFDNNVARITGNVLRRFAGLDT
jgi:N,N-dimethylformamidase